MKWIIANWKMHYGPIKAGAWIRAFRRERLPKDLEIAVAVPHVSLAAARSSLGRAGAPLLGAQNVFWMNEGAYTGETSPEMLKEFGTTLCIVGHSERRLYLQETDEMISKKTMALVEMGIRPVICVGENRVQREHRETLKVVRSQLTAALSKIKKGDLKASVMVAYEPLWSIGTGKACSPLEAKDVHMALREILKKTFGDRAREMPILYGGSVDGRNVNEYLSTTEIDGVLIGGASLDPRAFALLCRTATQL